MANFSMQKINIVKIAHACVQASGSEIIDTVAFKANAKAAGMVRPIGKAILDCYRMPGHRYNFEGWLAMTPEQAIEDCWQRQSVPSSPVSVPPSVQPSVQPTSVQPTSVPPSVQPTSVQPTSVPPVPVQPVPAKIQEQPFGYYIPENPDNFVSHGEMGTLQKILSNQDVFLPVYIYGETGIAKSMSVIAACAKAKRELFRLNVNIMTTEEDFIGGFRLVQGETVFEHGPLVLAMKRGAVLLIDEISALSPNNAFCLFSVLEGNPLYIKKTNEVVKPAKGFTIVCTDNTRGKGDTSGRYIGTNVQNDALLDRFAICLKYDYPTPAKEEKILAAYSDNAELIKELVLFAGLVRKTYQDGIIDESISTRKLVTILQVYSIFQDVKKCLELVFNRMEDETKSAIMGLWEKIATNEYSGIDMDNPDNNVDNVDAVLYDSQVL